MRKTISQLVAYAAKISFQRMTAFILIKKICATFTSACQKISGCIPSIYPYPMATPLFTAVS